MNTLFRRFIAVTTDNNGSVTIDKVIGTSKVGVRPPGVDLRVPVRFGPLGIFFFSNQGLALAPSVLAKEWTQLYDDDGMTCLIARPHKPGELNLLTTRYGVLYDLSRALELEIGDACVDMNVGLYVAGVSGRQPMVSLLNCDGELIKSWNLGSSGDSLEWGAVGQQWAGYLVGDKFFVKEPDSSEFEDYAVPPSSKVFWTNVLGGAFVLRRNDGWIQLISPKSGASLKLFRLADNEDLLRIDDELAVVAMDKFGTSYRHQSLLPA